MVFEVILNRGLVGKDIKVKVGNIEKFVKKNEALGCLVKWGEKETYKI